MPALVLCTNADVYNRFGGEAALAQAIDPEGTGTYSTGILTLAIQDASNRVASAAGVQAVLTTDPAYSQTEYQDKFPELVTLAAQLALILCWTYGTSGRALPDNLAALNVSVEAQLQLLAERRRKHGAVDYSPAPNQAITQIDNDPDRNRMVLSSWRNTGFG